MADPKKIESTTPVPIFVAPGTGGDHAADCYLTMIDWLLRDELAIFGDVQGELSSWIAEVFAKPVEFERHDIPEQKGSAVQREAMRESFTILANPQEKAEMKLGDLLETSYSRVNRMMDAIQQGDVSAADEIREQAIKALSQEFVKQATEESISALASLAVRSRALRAGVVCITMYRESPVSLINSARKGNRDAVLKLIKLDKLFLTDSCTSEVIRRAELQNDRAFLGRLARAVNYKSKMNWRQGCRLYIYLYFALGADALNLTGLWHRVDSDGRRFASFGAFEKFVERCKREFARITAQLPSH